MVRQFQYLDHGSRSTSYVINLAFVKTLFIPRALLNYACRTSLKTVLKTSVEMAVAEVGKMWLDNVSFNNCMQDTRVYRLEIMIHAGS